MRKTIKSLEEQLKKERDGRMQAQDRIDKVCHKVGAILGRTTRYGNSVEPVELESIPQTLQAFKSENNGMTLKEGEILPWVNQYMINENAKLWYLIRAAMKDETLKSEPANFENPMRGGKNSPFNKPNFDI